MAEKKPPKDSRPETNKKKSNEPAETPSIADRVKSSASGLLRDTIAPSNAAGHSFGSDLSNALSSKPSASSPSSSSSRTALDNSLHSSSSRSLSSSSEGGESASFPARESFRSSWTSASEADNQERAWEQTFADGDSVNAILNDDQHDLSQSKGKGRLVDVDEHTPLQPPPNPEQQQNEAVNTIFDSTWSGSVANQGLREQHLQQHPQDGSDVSALLSDPSFQPLYDFDEADDIDQTPKYEARPAPLKSNQRTPIPDIDSAALIPDVENTRKFLEGIKAEDAPTILRELGIWDWLAVDERYQDEVWGDLKPFVEAAKKEVEEKEQAGESDVAGGPAVARLRMVLGHFKDRGVRLDGHSG